MRTNTTGTRNKGHFCAYLILLLRGGSDIIIIYYEEMVWIVPCFQRRPFMSLERATLTAHSKSVQLGSELESARKTDRHLQTAGDGKLGVPALLRGPTLGFDMGAEGRHSPLRRVGRIHNI